MLSRDFNISAPFCITSIHEDSVLHHHHHHRHPVLSIHEPQCLKKWQVENDKLPPPVHRQADGWWYGRVSWLYTPGRRCLWWVYCGGQSRSDCLLHACTTVVRVARDVERQAAQATATAGTQETAATLTPVCTVQSVRSGRIADSAPGATCTTNSPVVSDTTQPIRRSGGVSQRTTTQRRRSLRRYRNAPPVWPIMCKHDVIHETGST